MSVEEATQSLQAIPKEALDGLDFKLSALAAAAAHYRRSTVCTPFPTALFEHEHGRDYDALLHCLNSLPSVSQLADPQALARLTREQLLLLHWLAGHPRRPVSHMRRTTLDEVRTRLPGLRGWVSDISFNESLRPAAVLQLAPVPGAEALARQTLAWHGTSFENMHSVLHTGLLNLSGTRLERTGAAFGKGIYFSSELTVAFAFCQPAAAWKHGARLRCLLVCGIDSEHAQHGSGDVPEKYLVVQRSDVVTMYYCFVYVDQPSMAGGSSSGSLQQQGSGLPGQGQQLQQQRRARWRVSPWLILLVSYLAWLLWQGLQNWPWLRRWVRRQLGIRI